MHTVGQVARLTDEELLSLRNFGVGCLSEVREALRAYATPRRTPLPDDHIDSLGLSPRARNALARRRVRTVRQLARLTNKELLAIWHFGRRSLSEVRYALRTYETGTRGASRTRKERENEEAPPSIRAAYRIAVRELTIRQRRILERRWGINDGARWTLAELGAELGVTRERIRQIESQLKRKLAQCPTARREQLAKPMYTVINVAAECTEGATSEDDLLANLRGRGIDCDPRDLRILGLFTDVGWVKGWHSLPGARERASRTQPV
jgi:hypothetical protein